MTAEFVERRRSERLRLKLPVAVRWKSAQGEEVKIEVETETVNAHGAMLRIPGELSPPSEMELTCTKTGQSSAVEAVWIDEPAEDGLRRVALSLPSPNAELWGLSGEEK
jgi:hypothetical protein